MRDIATKVDDASTLPADAFNSDQNELENVVTSADLTLDPDAGPDTDLNMLAKAIAAYANAGNTYQDSGAADAYVLSLATNLKAVAGYYDNMAVIFKAGNTNTGASTVNVESLGVKNITLGDGTALSAGAIVANKLYLLVYNLSNTRFEIVNPSVDTVPAFQATRSGSNQTVSSTAQTKIQFNNEVFDTTGDYDPTTNYRWTPSKKGKYFVTVHVRLINTDTGTFSIALNKNGANYRAKTNYDATAVREISFTALVDMNGTTDYLEAIVQSSTDTSYDVQQTSIASAFEGSWVSD